MNHAFTSGCGSTFLRFGKLSVLSVTLRLFASGPTVYSKISLWAFSTSASVRMMPMPRTHQTGTSDVKSAGTEACLHTSLRRHDRSSFHTSLFSNHLHGAGLGNHKPSHLRKSQRKFACCIHQQRKNTTEIDEINTHTCGTQTTLKTPNTKHHTAMRRENRETS